MDIGLPVGLVVLAVFAVVCVLGFLLDRGQDPR